MLLACCNVLWNDMAAVTMRYMNTRRIITGIAIITVLIFGLIIIFLSPKKYVEQIQEEEVSPQQSLKTQISFTPSPDHGGLRDTSDTLLPQKAQETYSRLLRASAAHDYKALELELRKPRHEPFRFSVGVLLSDLAIPFWKEQKKETGRDPLDTLHVLLGGVPNRTGEAYIWPRWSNKKLGTLNAQEQDEAILFTGVDFNELLEAGEYYRGPRTALNAEGVWLYFIEGI